MQRRRQQWTRGSVMSTVSTSDVFYDGTDFEIARNPYPVFKRLRDEAPLYYNDDRDFYAVSRFDDVAAVLVDNKNFINRYGGTLDLIKSGIEIPAGTVLFEDEPAHGIHRSLLARAFFTPKNVAALDGQIRQFCTDVLDSLEPGGFDFAKDIGEIVPMRVIGMLLGLSSQQQDELRKAMDDYAARDENNPGRLFDTSLLIDYVKWRRDNPSDDVVTKLLNSEFEDEHGERRTLTLDELLMYVNVLAAAGNETTGRLITYCGQLLADHPDQRRMLVDDLELMPNAVEEALRYEAPAIEGARFVANDVEIHGQTVPAGSAIAALLASANRDERHYENPDDFDITRNASNMSLSFGPHYCLGANLARIEARIVMEEVLKRYPEWEIDTDNAVFEVSPPLRSWEKLPVVVPAPR
jgi:cytochrome P450